jgi:gluconolactonase
MADMPNLTTLAEGLRFPEGPVAMPDGSIALVEIEAGRITAVTPAGEKRLLATPGGGPNGMALGPGGKLFVCNNGGFVWHDEPDMLRPTGPAADYTTGRIEVVDPATGSVERLYDRCGEHRLKGPNDIVFDPREGFWFSDLGKVRGRDRDHGGVYWAKADGSEIRECAFPVFGGANGIGLAPDGRTLYVAETETGRLWAWMSRRPACCARSPGHRAPAAACSASSRAIAGSTAWRWRHRATSSSPRW